MTAEMSSGVRRYHHGNLRAALVAEGLAVTRTGGPDALVLRDVARRIGVSPNAAYRHFADRQSLLRAVVDALQDQIAAEMAARRSPSVDASADRPEGPDAAGARAALRAVGLGYIDFALAEPGWFDVAFDPQWLTAERLTTELPAPFAALLGALDGLVEAGVLAPGRRAGAEWPCWSAVHGFAVLAVHGPLRGLPEHDVRASAARTVDAVIVGLLAPAQPGEESEPPAQQQRPVDAR